jgi:hypothetical protein
MGYVTDNTVWPEHGVPQDIRNLLDLFFSLADHKAEESGPRLAEEVFLPEGRIEASKTFQGSQGNDRPPFSAWLIFRDHRFEGTRLG